MITKRELYKLIDSEPIFLDHLIDALPEFINTKQVIQITGYSQSTIQRFRDNNKIECKRLKGSKRTYVYRLLDVIKMSWDKKNK